MNKKIPAIHESPEHLLQLMREAQDGFRKQRLNALYLLQSQQANTRQDVAAVLGVHRDTVGRWLKAYEEGGLSGLLTKGKAKGKTPLLPAEVQADLKERLQSPAGFKSYKEIQQFIQDEYGINISYKTVHKLVHYKWKAKLKVPRKSHKKKRSGSQQLYFALF